MKHTEETKIKISETLKRKGIKPTVLPSREQCIKNLEKTRGQTVWNKGRTDLPPSWNAGLKGYMSGENNCNWNGGKPKCIDCGKELSSYNAKRCPECYYKFNKGSNVYNWKGGLGGRMKQLRSSGEYKVWRLDVYQRDWFTCQMPGCGYKGKYIEAHHIVRVADDESLMFNIENGITLCKECHSKIRNKEKEYEELFRNIIKTK